ncbi:MAG: hypothetical protein U0K91_07755 [Acutalibacteraceae bacterium]|nr:hypothetical protein [Acutalibacteraceae bacterium]
MTLGTIYVIFKKLICLISAIMLMVVGADEKDLPSPDGAEVIAKNTYVLTDYQMSSQGVTNDGEYLYFSGNENLGKADMESGEIFLINANPIPKELKDKGCNHIGGLSYYNGYIYAAVEDGPDYLNSFIVLYDAETLKFTGTYYELPHELHIEGVPWCAVDIERNYLYTAEWSNATVLNVFSLDDMSLVKTVPLSEPIDRIQGAEMFNGKLYMSCDELNDMKRIFTLDVETGKVEVCFTRNIGEVFEAEGLTVFADENGEPVICVLDRGERRKSSNLTFYKLV